MNKAKTLLLFVLAIVLITPVLAKAEDSYQYSFGAIYQNLEVGSDFEATLKLLGLAYYFNPVSYNKGPYEEATFLDRQTNFVLAFGTVKHDYGSIVLDGKATILIFTFAEQTSPLTFEIGFSTSNADETITGNTVDLDSETIVLTLGYYITDRSVVEFLVSKSEVNFKVNGNVTSEYKADIMGFDYHFLNQLSGNRFFGLDAGYRQSDNIDNDVNSEVRVNADYYLNRKIGIHGGFAVNTGDDSSEEGKATMLGISAFLSQSAEIKFSLEKFSADEDGQDEDLIAIELYYNF